MDSVEKFCLATGQQRPFHIKDRDNRFDSMLKRSCFINSFSRNVQWEYFMHSEDKNKLNNITIIHKKSVRNETTRPTMLKMTENGKVWGVV